MSAQNKRRNFLIGFGAVAVVLAAVVAMWPPNWPREQASAAVGAVEKHRETQITQKDVILTDEPTRQEEATLYGDFLDDASKLQNISAELAAARGDEDLEARAIAARDSMLKHENDVQARYAARLSNTLDAMKKLANDVSLDASQRAALQAEIDQIAARMNARAESKIADYDSINARLQAIDDQLQARIVAVRKAGGEQLESDLEGLGARKLENRDAENLQARLSAISRDMNAARLNSRAQVEYLGALASQARAMQMAKAELAARNYAKLSARLSAEAEAMEAQASRNLQARLNNDAEMAARLQSIDRSFAGVRQIAARDASTIDARIQSALQASLKDAEQAVGARRAEYQARLSGRFQSELGALNSYLKNRDEIAARLAGVKAVEARLSNESDLGARKLNAIAEARINMQARLAARPAFAKYVGNLDQALNGNRDFASLAGRERLSLEARGLQARLQARAN